jgi:hypothetical protein
LEQEEWVMAVAVFIRFPHVTVPEYDALMAQLGVDASPAIGEILHIATEAPGGSVEVCEIWQTEEAASAFLDQRLRPALAAQGSRVDFEVRVTALHNLFAPDLEMVERIGAVSLPAYASSVVL